MIQYIMCQWWRSEKKMFDSVIKNVDKEPFCRMLLSIKEDVDIGERTTGCATALPYINIFFSSTTSLVCDMTS